MNIDEAIKHCEEVAEEKESICNVIENKGETWTDSGKNYYDICKKCASEHRQLAEWLRELKALRIAVYKLSRIPYGEYLTYKADDIWDLFGTYFADFEEEVMDYEEVNADE